jgi:hypothetical protein
MGDALIGAGVIVLILALLWGAYTLLERGRRGKAPNEPKERGGTGTAGAAWGQEARRSDDGAPDDADPLR